MQDTVFELLGLKWTPPLLRTLAGGERRFGELQRLLPDVKHKVLTQMLRRLEANGLIGRRSIQRGNYSTYALTDAARCLLPIIDSLEQWGTRHGVSPNFEGRHERSTWC